jgi:predicted SnoaL-like aldol condensation-catalyzing enzyme
MTTTLQNSNKARLIEGFDVLFNQRNFEAAEQYWAPDYIQHSSHIAAGRDGLFNLVRGLSLETRYEQGIILAEGDFVMAHGRYRDPAAASLVVVDIMRMKDGVFKEHWDVIQEEATSAQSKSGLPMFGDRFAGAR